MPILTVSRHLLLVMMPIIISRYANFLCDRQYTDRWPHLKKDKLLLESVQLQATRMASKQWKGDSASLNQKFSLPIARNPRTFQIYFR